MKRQPIVIEVTEEDVKKGKKGEATSCPVAMAAKRELGLDFVEVDESHPSNEDVWTISYHCNKGDKHVHPLTKSITRRIKRYDDGGKMRPFRFKLRKELKLDQ